MTFFTVLGRTFSSLILAWVRDKTDLPKTFIFRIIVFAFAFALLCVWTPMEYFLMERVYANITYPPLSNTQVNSGVVELQKKEGYLLSTTDGKKISLKYSYIYGQFENQYQQKGSLDNPKLFLKVWWFPMTNVPKGWIVQVEKDGQIVVSYEEQKKELKRLQEASDYFATKVLLVLMAIVFSWEFLVQYITYRQENN
jgi:hypothetical protein